MEKKSRTLSALKSVMGEKVDGNGTALTDSTPPSRRSSDSPRLRVHPRLWDNVVHTCKEQKIPGHWQMRVVVYSCMPHLGRRLVT